MHIEVRGQFKELKAEDMQKYDIAGGYKMLQGPAEKEKFANLIWSKMLLPKQSLLWLAVKNRLMKRSRISKFRDLKDVNCVLCDSMEETKEHLFFYLLV